MARLDLIIGTDTSHCCGRCQGSLGVVWIATINGSETERVCSSCYQPREIVKLVEEIAAHNAPKEKGLFDA